jgi:hypothetical protein
MQSGLRYGLRYRLAHTPEIVSPQPMEVLGRVLINRDCSAIAGRRKRRVRIAPDAQAIS